MSPKGRKQLHINAKTVAENQLCNKHPNEGNIRRPLHLTPHHYCYHTHLAQSLNPASHLWDDTRPVPQSGTKHDSLECFIILQPKFRENKGYLASSKSPTSKWIGQAPTSQPRCNKENSSLSSKAKQPCFQVLFSPSHQPSWRMQLLRDPLEEGSISTLRSGPVILNLFGL